MKITVHRQACCPQDDQAGPLEAAFSIDAHATFSQLVQDVVRSGFLQFSSTHDRITGEVEGKALVEVFSPHGAHPRQPEFKVDPGAPAFELLGQRVLSFHFRHV